MKLKMLVASSLYLLLDLQSSFANSPVIEYKSNPLYGDKKLSNFYEWNERGQHD